MKTLLAAFRFASVFIVGAIMAWVAAGPVHAQDKPTRYTAQPSGSVVKIQGTSTTHDWEMKGAIIGGYVEFAAGVNMDPARASIAGLSDDKVPATVKAMIPVRSVHSEAAHLPEVMDGLMQEALMETNHPRIEYHLSEMKPQGTHAAGQSFTFDTKGDLAIAGVTNKVSFPVTLEVVDANAIKISGTAKLKMTDYKVTPPAPNFGMGLMKCGDDVTIVLEWALKKTTN